MKYLHRWVVRVASAAFFLACSPAVAQWQTPNHSVPIGRGAGGTGFTSAAPGTAGLPLTSNGASSDPTFQALGNSGLAQMPANTVKCNPTGSTATAQDCTNPLILGLNIQPTINTLNQAFLTVQQLSGTTTSNCITGLSFQFPCANLFAITTDAVDASSTNALDGWQFAYNVGGPGASNIKGARQALDVNLNFQNATSASNTNRNYVAGVFQTNVFGGDGGTNTGAGAKGAFFGANAVIRGLAGATNLVGITGFEIDVQNAGTTQSRIGLNIVSFPSAQATNLTQDAAIEIYGAAGTGAVSWHNGIMFSNLGGFASVDSTGCLICTDGTANTVSKGIDFSAYTITSYSFKANNFFVTGGGDTATRHVVGSTSIPTAATCPGFALSPGSTDLAGKVTFTSAVNCVIAFGTAFTNPPFCVVYPNQSLATVAGSATTTGLSMSFGAAQTTASYICMGV